MTWNYYQYNILKRIDEFEYEVVEEFCDLQFAREQLKKYRAENPRTKYVLQSQHFIARIVS